MGFPSYASREAVMRALDTKESARNGGQVDRAIFSASRNVEDLCHRKFYPQLATRFFDWPDWSRNGKPWRLYLEEDEVILVTTLTSGGTIISASDFFLEPVNSGPPYTYVEIDLASSASFDSGDTHQRAIEITGLFGYRNDESPAGTLAEALDATETAVDVSDSASIGIGSLIRVDSERMIVTGKTMLDTGQNTGSTLTASAADVSLTVTTGSAYAVDEIILVHSERMLIVDISGNTLTLKRAWDGTTLAAHASGADIYAPRTLTVERGALGTTAAIHSTSTAISRHDPPPLVRDLVIAESTVQLQQEGYAYSRPIGTGNASSERSSRRSAIGRGIEDLRNQVYGTHGRKCRGRAV